MFAGRLTRTLTRRQHPTLFQLLRIRQAHAKAAIPSPLASTSVPIIPATSDDRALITLFDSPKPGFRLSLSPTGLFRHERLKSPNDLIALTQSTLIRAQLLTDRILRARESRDELLRAVKNLDRLSDLLCGVIDLSELVRNAHPDQQWTDAANVAYESLCEFMNVLNTEVGLYEVLHAVFSDPTIVETLSPEAYQTALIFWRDFEKSAIHLPPQERQKFVTLSSEILVLGRQFLDEAKSPRSPVAIKPAELAGLKDPDMGSRMKLQSQFSTRDLLVYPGSLQAQMIMRSAPQEEPRRKLYVAANSSKPEQVHTLEKLLKARCELAHLVGRDSFAHMTLDDKMAKSPENVAHFLDALMTYTRPYARKALRSLSRRKRKHLGLGPDALPTVQAWDRDFYCPPEPPIPPIPLPPLTVGVVFMAFSRLCKHLYGITLRPADVKAGEVWHGDVHKMEVIDEEQGLIGWIYADLYARRGKASGAAHYTVRCSRRTDKDHEELDHTADGVELSQEFEAVKRTAVKGQEGTYQLPLVVLLCEFPRPSIARGATALDWHEVLTLFHEMGHAMHSMIGRTEYQNVAGTRCATDFVELPSILMEHFLSSPTVLSLFNADQTRFNTHHNAELMGKHQEDACHAIDTHAQIILAAVDQLYHSKAVEAPRFSSTQGLAELCNTKGLMPHVPGTSFQTQFGHLFGYGATYYSYLFDRAIASRVWSKVFSPDPLSRESGERYKGEVLKWGGGRDPWRMVGKLLRDEGLEGGDKEAMRQVGEWRIEDEVSVPGRH